MSLFGNKKKYEQAKGAAPSPAGASYDQVIDFMVFVNEKDHQKIIKVVEIYRKANIEVARATGVKPEPVPSIFKHQTVPAQPAAPSLLEDDDELVAAFEGSEDDEPVTPARKAKTTVKVTTPNGDEKDTDQNV